MKIPYFTFDGAPNSIINEWTKSIQSVIAEGKFVLGDQVHKFESEWAEFLGVNHAVGVANGFDALVLSLKTLGIGAGDIVAVPSHTFAATWISTFSSLWKFNLLQSSPYICMDSWLR
jgi:dTDP-3-amino-3,4,6-trideoxy-alpha-D-glucose transaminase